MKKRQIHKTSPSRLRETKNNNNVNHKTNPSKLVFKNIAKKYHQDILQGEHSSIKLIEPIGSGACAEVWKGEITNSTQENRYAAIKISLPRGASLAAESAFLLKLAGIKGIPNVIDQSTNVFLAMPLLNTSLDALLKSSITRSLSHNQLRPIFASLLNTLREVSQRGILHCDIKPESIMLDTSSNPFLIDWGVAALREWKNPTIHPSVPTRFVGTLKYASPRAISDGANHVDTIDDVISLLVVMLAVGGVHLPWENCKDTIRPIEQRDAGLKRFDQLQEILKEQKKRNTAAGEMLTHALAVAQGQEKLDFELLERMVREKEHLL